MSNDSAPQGDRTDKARDDDPAASDGEALGDCVRGCVRQYLDELDGELCTDFYQLVLSQVEAPLLEEVMRHTRSNQSRAAQLLGLNRGTLRKKLRHYGIADEP